MAATALLVASAAPLFVDPPLTTTPRLNADQAPYRFAEMTRRAGVDGESRTWGAAFADHDRDGDPDLFVGRHWGYPKLYSNSGGQHDTIAVADLRVPSVDRHACAWGEANGDGAPDLYCVRGANKGRGEGPNQLFLQGPGGLEDHGAGYGVTDPLGRGRTVNWLDYDSDGDLDIFVGNTTRAGAPNVLFRNAGGSFERTTVGLEHELSTVSSSWADWDVDGDPDLLVMQHVGLPTVAYRNDGGAFHPVDIPHVTDRHWNAGSWADFDSDGRPDLHLVSEDSALLLRNGADGFEPVSRIALVQGRMSAWLDVENDGDLDLFVVQGARGNHPTDDRNHPDFLLVNGPRGFRPLRHSSFAGPPSGNGDAVAVADHDGDGRQDVFVTNGLFHWRGRNVLLENRSDAAHWAGVTLRGPVWNPFGFGAVVTASTHGATTIHHLSDSFVFRSQSDPGHVHLGLGHEVAVRIRVDWPDGTRDCSLAAAGTQVVVGYGDSPCRR